MFCLMKNRLRQLFFLVHCLTFVATTHPAAGESNGERGKRRQNLQGVLYRSLCARPCFGSPEDLVPAIDSLRALIPKSTKMVVYRVESKNVHIGYDSTDLRITFDDEDLVCGCDPVTSFCSESRVYCDEREIRGFKQSYIKGCPVLEGMLLETMAHRAQERAQVQLPRFKGELEYIFDEVALLPSLFSLCGFDTAQLADRSTERFSKQRTLCKTKAYEWIFPLEEEAEGVERQD
jgi:hypothetical protein